ncbi:Uncharacterised protein [Candidatus Gugararchaeum adminiculabundum]|nr:Uncharacterised protein [Candidatus Gugararchaeum adminiculabundum]
MVWKLFSQRRKLYILWMLGILAIGFVSAASTGLGGIEGTVSSICGTFKTLVPVVAMLMLLAAGALYAAGQVMGAETRARANVWSTAMLTGALIGILIALIGPAVLNMLITNNTDKTLDANSVKC